MSISAQAVKDLRARTGAGMMDCKRALQESDGDAEKAIRKLREKGIASASKKAGRAANEGALYAYVHPGNRIASLVEINCETDFVARNPGFLAFVKDVAMQIVGHQPSPRYVRRDQVPAEVVEAEKEIYATQARNEGKPENVIDRIVEGKLKNFYKQACLLEQEYVKDSDKSIEDLVKEKIAEFGENIVVQRFVRFQVGE